MKKPIILPIILFGYVFSMQGMLVLQKEGNRLSRVSRYRKAPVGSVTSHTNVSNRLSTGIQKRAYSSSRPQQSGLWNSISSFFTAKNQIFTPIME